MWNIVRGPRQSRRDDNFVRNDEPPGRPSPARTTFLPPSLCPLLIGSSLFRLPFNPPWAKTRLQQQVCSLNDVCLPHPLLRPLPMGPSSSRFVYVPSTPHRARTRQQQPHHQWFAHHARCHRVLIYLVFCVSSGT